MKKVLMIAHQFPPVGGSGVQRTTKFVKYLRNFGWEPVVFTRDVKGMSLKDETLLSDIPENVKVVRTSPWNLTELPGLLVLPGKFINRKVLIPDGERLWQHFGRKTAEKVVAEDSIDLIYTTSYPYSDHLMGLHLKKKYPDIPWVADFRDEWTKNPNILDYHYGARRTAAEKKLESLVLQSADQVITNTPIMMENFVEDDQKLRNKFHVIPNGYDEDDFQGLDTTPPSNDRFTVTYTGLLYGRRKPDLFMEAVSRLLAEDKLPRENILIRLIGNFKESHINGLIERFNLQGIVEALPYMKHRDSIQQLLKADALLLLAGAGEEAFYLGKIFEYMRTGRPMLAIVPEKGAAASLIRETQTGYVSDSSDLKGTMENVMKLYEYWKSGNITLSPQWDKIHDFERRVLTRKLSEVFAKASETCKKQK